MAAGNLNILMLFDLSIPLSAEQIEEYLKTDDWQGERNLLSTLKKLGHNVKLFGLLDDLQLLVYELRLSAPDVVFNLSEAFRGDRRYEPHIAAVLELMNVPFTGSRQGALTLSKNKSIAKKVLSFHDIKVPNFIVSRKSSPIRNLSSLKFPVFVKPLNLEASEGISQLSFAEKAEDAIERVLYLHGKYETDVIVEEYIEGRELYVGVIGNERLQSFPPRELFFSQKPEGEPKFASFKAKWDDNYRKKWGIRTGHAQLTEVQEQEIAEVCKRAYRALGIRGYGRIDLRLTPEGEIYCLEANPNPSIEKDGDFALSAIKAGLSYEDLVSKILSLGLNQSPF